MTGIDEVLLRMAASAPREFTLDEINKDIMPAM
jgi:hypothetical protein